jgi:hypothetical protein
MPTSSDWLQRNGATQVCPSDRISSTARATSPRVAACTIAAKSYLSYVRVLASSFRRYHPDIPFYVLLADEVDGYFDPAAEPFQLLRLSDIDVPRLERIRFHYGQQPLSYAATPYFLAHLLDRGFQRVLFFKQESLVLGDVSSLVDLLDRSSILLTPHLLRPLAGADRIPRELVILLSGTFNAGVLGVSRTATTGRFLAWWKDRVSTHCRHAVPEGMHYEQRWLDLVPGLFEDVHVLRDSAYNVGHWNLPERSVEVHADRVLVDGSPCKVFRFSGYSPDDPRTPTKYFTRLTWENVGPAREVFSRFGSALEAAGYHETKAWPYAYGSFDNGAPVPELARSLYLELGEEVARFGDPLHTGHSGSYFDWLNESVDGSDIGPGRVTRLWHAVYRARGDLQAAFRDPFGADRRAFLDWTVSFGMDEHGISDRFMFVDGGIERVAGR